VDNQENDTNDPFLDVNIDMKEFAVSIESLNDPPEMPIEQDSIAQTETTDEAEADPPPAIGPLDEIKQQLDSLSKAFESKLKYDEHKNKIIDELHQNLQEYRQGLVQKYVNRIFIDVLKVVDDIRKFSAHYINNRGKDETTDKFLNFLESTASDLEDLFSWEGIKPFVCEGSNLDTTRQRVTNKMPTDDPSKDKLIAERIRPGYEWNGKIIRPEIVSVFIYQNNGSANGEKTDDQTSSS
jgi:molecular chaperone GrpE